MKRIDEVKRHAVCLMAQKGFEAMSLRQLAASLGMSSGAIYSHYESKAQLLVEVYCDYLEGLLSAWAQHRNPQMDRTSMLQSFVRIYVDFHFSRPAESVIVQLDFRSLGLADQKKVEELKDNYQAELEAILQRNSSRGVSQIADRRDSSVAILCVLQGVCSNPALTESSALGICLRSVARLVGWRSLNKPQAHDDPRYVERGTFVVTDD